MKTAWKTVARAVVRDLKPTALQSENWGWFFKYDPIYMWINCQRYWCLSAYCLLFAQCLIFLWIWPVVQFHQFCTIILLSRSSTPSNVVIYEFICMVDWLLSLHKPHCSQPCDYFTPIGKLYSLDGRLWFMFIGLS